ncbi:MAG: bifunctional 5,10-methylenetetrahydrofolate dehydrogenase/5,10-methenyltetrahydrofolate cyclohydrolase, partial [Thermoleophilia bacterium]|nr:bifunctional 5,10-methylenetetrahydrofolate dehydrogenase/5,10-methenyltetrahydrofolate cyclohydrolase [Thermoleophilia bacterium]
MSAEIIDGKAAGADVRALVAERAAAFTKASGRKPGLVGIQVGEDPASEIYQRMKAEAAEAAGMRSERVVLPAGTSQEDLDARIAAYNDDDTVDGMLVQLPVPEPLTEPAIANAIDPVKDVDGFSPGNLGRLMRGEPAPVPCTPSGVMWLLEKAGVQIEGAHAVVVGRSLIVGKPQAMLLLAANATTTVAHSRTKDLPGLCRQADILIAAVGRPEMIRGDWIKPGAAVI